MQRAAPARLVAGVVGLVMVATAGVLAVTTQPAPADGRQAAASPASDLANQVIFVSWSGFTPTSSTGDNSVILYQCKAGPVSLADCFTGEPFPAVAQGTRQIGRTGDDGTGAVLFEVRPAAKLPDLGCSKSSPCSILLYENDGKPFPTDELPATAVTVPLEFAPSQADCPPVDTFDLRADGEASAAPLFYRWAATRCTGDEPLVLDYTETSSNEGRANALEGLVDIGLTSEETRADEVEAHPEAGSHTYAPIDLTAVTVVLNMKDPFTGKRLEDVVLTPRLVAMLITDSDVAGVLGDPELRTLNPGVRFPTVALGYPLLRAERNADTRLLTTWISKDEGAKKFLAGDDEYGAPINPAFRGYEYPKDLFENVGQSSQFVPRAGQEEVARRMFYAVQPNGTSSERTDEVGFIGVVDLAAARRYGLPTARLVNASGIAVAPTEESLLAGYREMIASKAGVLATNTQPEADDAYPLVKVDYAMISDKLAPADKRTKMSSFLRYAAGDGQKVLPPGYVALPEALRTQTVKAAGSFAPAPETTTTTTTTSTPTDPFGESGYVPTDGGYVDDGSGYPYDAGSSGTGTGTGSDGGAAGAGGKAAAGAKTTKAGGTDAGPSADSKPVLPLLPVSRSAMMAPAMLAFAGIGLLWWALSGLSGSLRRRRSGPTAGVAS